MLATILISAALLCLFALAIRHIVKNGSCSCGEKTCGGNCAHCSHCAGPKKQAKHS